MSTKATIAMHYGKSPDCPAILHLYSCCFSDMVSLDVTLGFHMNTTVALPLPFVMEIAAKLQEHIKPIKEILQASDAQLQVKARIAASRICSSKMLNHAGLSEEQLFEQEFERLKDLQEQYKEAMNEGS